MSRSLALAAPFVLAVPVLLGVAFVAAGHDVQPLALAAGAIGWMVALALRAPVALVGLRALGSGDRLQRLVVLASGPAEEGVRLVVVLLVGRDLGTALWIGLGWAAIEVVYSIVNSIAVAQLERRTDPEAEAARAMLPPAALGASAPWWGIVERAFASALHIGFTLIVAATPLAVVATAVVHSAFNVGFLALLRRTSTAAVMALGSLIGGAAFLIGLWMHGAI